MLKHMISPNGPVMAPSSHSLGTIGSLGPSHHSLESQHPVDHRTERSYLEQQNNDYRTPDLYLDRSPPARLLELSPLDRSFLEAPLPLPPPAAHRTPPEQFHPIYGNTSYISNGKVPNGYLAPQAESPARTSQVREGSGAFGPVRGAAEAGVKEMLTSLGLLCLVSLLLALLALVFLLKITPVTAGEIRDFLQTDQLSLISPEEYVVVYEVTLALCAVTLSLNLCCLLVCAVQFLFAVKLVKAAESGTPASTSHYLHKSNVTRIVAVGGFFISIPVFLTGIILYTFIQFHSTPAIITSSLIGAGIIYCGCAMVHNVFVWQMEKTNAVRAMVRGETTNTPGTTCTTAGTTPEDLVVVPNKPTPLYLSPAANLPQATLDLSTAAHELSTLV